MVLDASTAAAADEPHGPRPGTSPATAAGPTTADQIRSLVQQQLQHTQQQQMQKQLAAQLAAATVARNDKLRGEERQIKAILKKAKRRHSDSSSSSSSDSDSDDRDKKGRNKRKGKHRVDFRRFKKGRVELKPRHRTKDEEEELKSADRFARLRAPRTEAETRRLHALKLTLHRFMATTASKEEMGRAMIRIMTAVTDGLEAYDASGGGAQPPELTKMRVRALEEKIAMAAEKEAVPLGTLFRAILPLPDAPHKETFNQYYTSNA